MNGLTACCIGRLAVDAEQRFLGDGTPLVSCRLAVTRGGGGQPAVMSLGPLGALVRQLTRVR